MLRLGLDFFFFDIQYVLKNESFEMISNESLLGSLYNLP